MGNQKQAESKFVVALDFVNMKRSPVRTGAAMTEAEALSIVDAQIGNLRNGVDIAGHKPADVYSVYAYENDSAGKPDRLVNQKYVRETGRKEVSAAA